MICKELSTVDLDNLLYIDFFLKNENKGYRIYTNENFNKNECKVALICPNGRVISECFLKKGNLSPFDRIDNKYHIKYMMLDHKSHARFGDRGKIFVKFQKQEEIPIFPNSNEHFWMGQEDGEKQDINCLYDMALYQAEMPLQTA